MLKNYIITAWRKLTREKGSALLNLSGLTLGITCSLILFLLVKHLASFDGYHTKCDRIYRVVRQSDGNQQTFYTPGVPAVLPDAFRQDFMEAEEVTFTSYRSGALVLVPQPSGEWKKFSEEGGVVFAQSNFFKIFDRAIIIGKGDHGLDNPNEAIISKKLALKYFSKVDAVGEVVKVDTIEYKITAVMEDHPQNTDFPFGLMLSYNSIKKSREENGWNSTWSDEQCYFLLKEDESIASVEARLPAFVEKYLGKDNYDHSMFLLQPLRELHFDDRFGTYTYNTVPWEWLISLAIIAVFLIVTACINFVNLATAEAIKRSKEVGIRKSLGGTRGQLVRQFLGETTGVTILAMIISAGLTQVALGFLNAFLEIDLSLDFASDSLLWVFIIGVTAVVSLLSGLYPSLVISGFTPVLALKNKMFNRDSSGYNLRRGLVVLQFVISQFFIIGTIVMISQMNYFSKKELGFRKDAIIVIPIPEREVPAEGTGVSKMRTLREEVSQLASVEMASLANTPPSSGSVNGTGFRFEGEGEEARKDTEIKQIDGHYINLFGLQLVAGESLEDGDTARAFVVNEQLTRIAGFKTPQEIIGKRMRVWGKVLPVVGVVRDFHSVSLREPIEPVVMMNRIRGFETLSLKINPSQLQDIIKEVRLKWEAAYPNHIFDYTFLDEQIRDFYEREKKMSILLSVFTSMAIFIGCLGLFGLATFMANQKTKEIGVRKVLGASAESIVISFCTEYFKLIMIGFVIAAPLSWLVMNEWLNGFEYKVTMGAGMFLASLAITLLVALLTVGYKSLKAAITNPVNSLRYE